MLVFPPGFLFGVATSAYQIEGAVNEDGRGETIWDRFCATPGKVANGDSGAVACDHYHRWAEDLDLIRDLGVGAYRFSVAWSRIQADGRGTPNPKGIAFYDRLVDGLLDRGLQPFVTLYHWDLPQALEDKGGWRNRDTAAAFADYAEIVARTLGNRVTAYATFNEPFCTAMVGHYFGEHAPGMRDLRATLGVMHNLLLGHGLAIPRMRAAAPRAMQGIVLNFTPTYPAGDSAQDRRAARLADGFNHRLFLDPLYRGAYPEDMVAQLGANFPEVRAGDLEIIAAPLDYLGVNYYTRAIVRGHPDPAALLGLTVEDPGVPRTAMGWEVHPPSLTELLLRLHTEYGQENLYVTENGAAYDDRQENGVVEDEPRRAYFEAHLAAVLEAMRRGAPVKGYFAWSLMDNFEWAWGYDKRFGIVHVDYATQRRTLKRSGRWYRDMIAAQDSARAAAV